MRKRISRAAILGSGTMGSGIASLLANVGVECYLLDIVPDKVTEEEAAKGLTLESESVRNRFAIGNKERFIKKARPASLMHKENADLITVGNLEDDISCITDCDWIIEVVPEVLEIKQQVLKTIQPYVNNNAIVSSNTSGISINKIAEDLPSEFKKKWLGTHFFNPVRYMKLMEIIPGQETLPEILDFMIGFGQKVLGKGVVLCKDTPNFIANRVGAALGTNVIKLMQESGLSVSEVDAITGTCIGRPKMATFALYDLVGLDIGVASATTVHDNVTDEEERKNLKFPEQIYTMLEKKMLGNKTRGGFYKKVDRNKLMIDLDTFEYEPVKKAEFESLQVASAKKTLAEKLEVFFEGEDVAAKFVWEHMKRYFIDTASKLPEICDKIYSVDRALCWGYNHDKGPFEIWQGLDLEKYTARMENEGETIPAWIKEMLSLGFEAFYKEENGIMQCYSIIDKKYMPVEEVEGKISLGQLKAENKVIKNTKNSTLVDIGDGVLCLDLHTRTTAISEELLDDMSEAQEELKKNWDGMVITGSGSNFCVGADLKSVLAYIDAKEWTKIGSLIKKSQEIYMRNKYSYKPVVVAPFGMVLGGGCEITMHSSAVQAAGETYMGLVELGVGLVPAGGGVKEMTLRALEKAGGLNTFTMDFIAPYLQSIATAKVSSSAKEAQSMGFIHEYDGITLNRDLLLTDAKKKVVELIDKSYTPGIKKTFKAPGQNDTALSALFSMTLNDSGMISDYDMFLINQLGYIMSGGNVSKGEMINEDYLLELEREVFVGLCKEAKTQERIKYMLTTGKPLRN